MGTIVKLYYTYSTISGNKWELIPSKLLVVEDIASYLATKTSKTINDFQYIKNELELSINVEIAQSYSQPRSETNFKYVSIQNPSEQIHYYFVKKATWRSKTCVRFELVMDVLNTFQEGRDFNFKANTRIVREHKDRFIKRVVARYLNFRFFTYVETGTIAVDDDVKVYDSGDAELLEGVLKEITYPETNYIQFKILIDSDDTRTDTEILQAFSTHQLEALKVKKDNSNYTTGNLFGRREITHDYSYFRKIDLVNEGVNPVLQCATAVGNKIEVGSTTLRKDWYLLYRNQEDYTEAGVNPVECYIIPEEATNVDYGEISSSKITASSLIYGKYYYARIYEENLFGVVLIRQKITLPDGTIIDGQDSTTWHYGTYLEITRNRAETINLVIYNYYNGNTNIVRVYLDLDYIQLDNLPFKYVEENSQHTSGFYLNAMWNNEEEWTDTTTPAQVAGINDLDRTDPKNIKLIKLPYVPYNFSVSAGKIQVSGDDKWLYTYFEQANSQDFYALKLSEMNIKLSMTLTETYAQPLGKLYFGSISPSLTDARKGWSYESKLYHSDFYQPTYVYDSFTYKVQLEKLDINLYTPTNVESFTIKFYMTSTINSRFMFEFSDLKFAYATENYAKYMPIARNNEEVLYNVPYINYIRNGFNYDVKAKERTNVSNVLGMGLSVGSTAFALAFAPAPLKVAGVVAGLVSMAMSIKNTVFSAQQNEESIRRKLQETANQASSVAGSDDVDLMSVYAENRLKYLVYEPTELMRSILFDLFFYAGYASGRMGIPNHNTRVNFDYLECEANLENEGSIPDDCLQELINCFKTGITYLHKTTRTSKKWDFNQEYENWEKSIMED